MFLVLLQVPKCFVLVQIFCAMPKICLHLKLNYFKKQHFFVITFMPCPFTGPKMFCASPNFLSQPKNLTAFSASSKPFEPAQKSILLNANHLFVWRKKFGPAQNILGPVKRQGFIKGDVIYIFLIQDLGRYTTEL